MAKVMGRSSSKRLLVLCDYHPGLLDSFRETLGHAGVADLVWVTKGKPGASKADGALGIHIPLSVSRPEHPFRVASIVSVVAYLFMAIIFGTRAVIKRRLNAVMAVFAFPQGLAGVLVGQFTRRKVVILTDGADIDIMLENPLIRPLVLACLRKASVVTALNRSKANRLLALGIRAQLCPTVGVDTSRFEYADFRQKEIQSILYVGRLSEEKCPETLIKACGRLNADDIPWKLLMIGDGPIRSRVVDSVISMGLTDHIVMKGYVEHSEMHRFYRESAIFVLPSAREGVSVALLEAMSCGCLCIVSDIPDNREIIRHMDNGMVFRLDDAEDLAEKIRRTMIESSELGGVARNARHLVEQKYSKQTVGDTLRRLLSEP